ncbi:hypothetical protein M8828_18270 [Aeromonas simiae]|uniref:fimbrial protein n=1 Tax=Aeromonas simiae TaxID=218936 RepID=UPI00266C187F|nr:fimbrial protein [Aeromonas simiae]MDO2950297.1 hypothetical protein [Aeromonas simiae]MDO2957720.1 hypothetical protein [Aeromonas simiae]
MNKDRLTRRLPHGLITLFAAGIVLWPMVALAVPAAGGSLNLNVSGVIVDTPDCTVNSGEEVDVDFGDRVMIRKLDGVTYQRREIVYDLRCDGLAMPYLSLSIRGETAAFGSGILKTNMQELGIQLFHDDVPLRVGETLNFTYGDSPHLYAVPIAGKPEQLSEGSFKGSGTMVFAYQ